MTTFSLLRAVAVSTRIAALVVAAIASTLASGAARADDFKIKDCDADAAADVALAYQFVANNLGKIFDPMTFLTSAQRSEMKKKWGRITVDCVDNKKKCSSSSTLLGLAHGGLGNQVNVCYYNHVDLRHTLCELSASLVHESGHANGLPSMKGHNNPTTAVFDQDLIYRMEGVAEAFCEAEAAAGRFDDAALQGVSRRAIGTNCSVDDQCTTSKCERNECVCKVDSDCSGTERCKKPLGGINQCRP